MCLHQLNSYNITGKSCHSILVNFDYSQTSKMLGVCTASVCVVDMCNKDFVFQTQELCVLIFISSLKNLSIGYYFRQVAWILWH